jgi:glycosyltransferase involved in cell wall biosynthesis
MTRSTPHESPHNSEPLLVPTAAEPARPAELVSIVLPCFNEADNLVTVYERVSAAAEKCSVRWEIVFVDDGSRDETAELLASICGRDRRVNAIVFTRNFGHQAALTAGLMWARGDAVITLDADLQHPPEMIPVFLQKWREGARVVQGVRRTATRGMGKALTSRIFYAWLNRFTEVEVEANAPDYRLLDRRVVNYLNAMREQGRFLRGQITWLGFPITRVAYDEEARHAGVSKYTLNKMINLAKDAVTSSSVRPLFFSAWLGFVLMLAALCYGAYGLVAKLLGHTATGWTSLMLAILIIGGVEMLVLSVHGLYIGQLLRESRSRPLFCIAETYGVQVGPGGVFQNVDRADTAFPNGHDLGRTTGG